MQLGNNDNDLKLFSLTDERDWWRYDGAQIAVRKQIWINGANAKFRESKITTSTFGGILYFSANATVHSAQTDVFDVDVLVNAVFGAFLP